MEQRANIKFCYKIGKTCPETYRLLKQVYGDDCLSRSQVFEWYGRFKRGRENLMDNGKSGRPKTATTQQLIDNISELIDSDISVSIRSLARKFNVSKDTINNILRNNLNKRRICDRFVPYPLNKDQELARIEHCKNIVTLSQMNTNFIDTIVTGDETWCLKHQTDLPNITCSNEIGTEESDQGAGSKRLQLQNKIKLICFYDSKGIVYKEFMMDPGGDSTGGGGAGVDDDDEDNNKKCKTIDDTEMYLAILQRLCWNINCVRPEYKTINNGNWSLLQTNTNRIASTREFLMKNNITTIEHPALSPDLSPCDYYLFPKLKLQLRNNNKGSTKQPQINTTTIQCSNNDIQLNVTNILDGIPKIELYESIHNLINRATRCIETNGQYLEKT